MNIQNSKLFKKLSVLLAFTMLLAMPTAAFAAWDTYGGNNEHNAVVSDAPTSSTPTVTSRQLTQNGSGAGNRVWNTTPDNYALGGMACDNGYIVFGNDRDRLYIVK